MSAWDAYPDDYRSAEIQTLLPALRAGECVSLIGLSGAGKSNLTGFLYQRMNQGQPAFVLVDGNRAQPRTAAGLFRLARQALGDIGPAEDEIAGLEAAAGRKLAKSAGGLCLLLDRYDALSEAEQRLASSPLRALRDSFKYQLTYLIATRRPLESTSELSELFYANTLWLGPLSAANARWSVSQYALRRGQAWYEPTIARLVEISWGYPSLLRACCEAYASGIALDLEALRASPAVQRRVQEFWSDNPSADDLRRSGLAGHPLLEGSPPAAQPAISADSPDLTASEHRLLVYLQAHPGEVCAKDDLIRAIWTEEKVVDGLRDDSLAQLIRRLRVKIGAERVQTIPGRGYRFMPL